MPVNVLYRTTATATGGRDGQAATRCGGPVAHGGRCAMNLREDWAQARAQWSTLSLYQRVEHAVILILTGLIAVIVASAVWNLTVKILLGLIVAEQFDPTDHTVFQALFGMILTVIIALEFKRSLLVAAERHDSVVQVRTVILLALLAIVRKLIILDLDKTGAGQLFALAAATLALGGVYWLVRDQDARHRAAATTERPPAEG